jgi:hypothetical protein
MLKHLHVELGSDDPLVLDFCLRNTSMAQRWADKIIKAQSLGYPIDDPDRFYGFESIENAQFHAMAHINQQIDVINDFLPLIDRAPQSVHDQDTLNYLHNIFEIHHGRLEQQNSDVWNNAPVEVRNALALLNTAVHRCESVARGNQPRAVITYYGLPKDTCYEISDYNLIERDWKFGTVYLCYAEIGKTLFDMAMDNDCWMTEDLFSPFLHYTADFVIRFNDADPMSRQDLENRMWAYYDANAEFFRSRGYHKDHPALRMGSIPVADLDSELDQKTIFDLIQQRQHINRVWLS